MTRTVRPAGAPAHYRGRPASWWMAAAQRGSAARPGPAAAGTAHQAGGLPVTTGDPIVDPGEACRQAVSAGLVVHRADPLNAETPQAALAGTTAVASDRFYVRNHFAIPDLDPATWRLQVGGLAGRLLSLTLADLRSMPAQTVVATLECAGNGRSALDPAVPGEQWGLGAAGTAAWTGVPLTDVLAAAAQAPGAQEVVFRGADRGQVEGRDGPVHFERSLPVRYLGSAGALLAYAIKPVGRPRSAAGSDGGTPSGGPRPRPARPTSRPCSAARPAHGCADADCRGDGPGARRNRNCPPSATRPPAVARPHRHRRGRRVPGPAAGRTGPGVREAGAVLIRANPARASLPHANLHGARLARANLPGANLEGANLAHASLSGANLDRAMLARASWPTGATVPEGWQLDDNRRLYRA